MLESKKYRHKKFFIKQVVLNDYGRISIDIPDKNYLVVGIEDYDYNGYGYCFILGDEYNKSGSLLLDKYGNRRRFGPGWFDIEYYSVDEILEQTEF